MFGLMVFGAIGLYLLVLIGATYWGYHHAAPKGSSRKTRWLWAGSIFLLVYLPVFWDWIPTIVMHQYYCATDSGFWVYKSVDQWGKDNPGAMEALIENKGAPSRSDVFDNGHGRKDTYFLNKRFDWVVIHQDIFPPLPIIRIEWDVIDVETKEVLARYVDFGTGNSVKQTIGPPGPLKFWNVIPHCTNGARNKSLIGAFEDNVRGR
jgi:hypothetical protein